jgi:hypothetical protein
MIGSAEEFARLRTSSNPGDQHRATWEAASEATWRDVIQDHPQLQVWVARNKTVPLSVLAILATDKDPAVRFAVAMKRKIDAGIFERLAADPDASVRHGVALNPKCPLHLLHHLARDDEDLVRREAANRLRNPSR